MKIKNGIKKWNWSLFFIVVCTTEIGALRNTNIHSIWAALLFGLVGGIVFGLPLAIITKDVE